MKTELLDPEMTGPVADAVLDNSNVFVAFFSNHIRCYTAKQHILMKSRNIPHNPTALLIHNQLLHCGTIQGVHYVLDMELNVLKTIQLSPNIFRILPGKNFIYTLSLPNIVSKLSYSTDTHEYELTYSGILGASITSAAISDRYLAIATGKSIKIIKNACHCNKDGVENFDSCIEKEFSSVICSIALDRNGFYVGMLNGKIGYIDYQDDAEKSFTFNAHTSEKNGVRTFYPVHWLGIENEVLYSAGADGKVLKWDVKKRCLLEKTGVFAISVKKCAMREQDHLYIIVEDVCNRGSLSKLYSIDMQTS